MSVTIHGRRTVYDVVESVFILIAGMLNWLMSLGEFGRTLRAAQLHYILTRNGFNVLETRLVAGNTLLLRIGSQSKPQFNNSWLQRRQHESLPSMTLVYDDVEGWIGEGEETALLSKDTLNAMIRYDSIERAIVATCLSNGVNVLDVRNMGDIFGGTQIAVLLP